MSKDKITEYSSDPTLNSDIGGISLLGTASPRVIKEYLPEQMAQLADMNSGVSPIDDTFTRQDPDDNTKLFREDAGNIPTGTTRIIDIEDVYQSQQRGGIPRVSTYYQNAGSFTHTFNADTKKFRAFLMGAGGDGGNVDGQGSSTGASASGGNSGNWGWTGFLSKGAITTATIVVGAAGTAATGASDNGCDGNDTTWSDGTNSYTVKGGKGGTGRQAGAQYPIVGPSDNSANTGTIFGTYRHGDAGQSNGGFTTPVRGGVSPYGECAPGTPGIGTGANGSSASGNGAGGGGAAVAGVATNYVGGRGAPGMIIVEEY